MIEVIAFGEEVALVGPFILPMPVFWGCCVTFRGYTPMEMRDDEGKSE